MGVIRKAYNLAKSLVLQRTPFTQERRTAVQGLQQQVENFGSSIKSSYKTWQAKPSNQLSKQYVFPRVKQATKETRRVFRENLPSLMRLESQTGTGRIKQFIQRRLTPEFAKSEEYQRIIAPPQPGDLQKGVQLGVTAYGLTNPLFAARAGLTSSLLNTGFNAISNKAQGLPAFEGAESSALTGFDYGAKTAGTMLISNQLVNQLANKIPLLQKLTDKSIKKTLPKANQSLKQWFKSVGKTGAKKIIRAALPETFVESLTYGVTNKKQKESLIESIKREAVENLIWNLGYAVTSTGVDALNPLIKKSVMEAVQKYKGMTPEERQAGYVRLPGKKPMDIKDISKLEPGQARTKFLGENLEAQAKQKKLKAQLEAKNLFPQQPYEKYLTPQKIKARERLTNLMKDPQVLINSGWKKEVLDKMTPKQMRMAVTKGISPNDADIFTRPMNSDLTPRSKDFVHEMDMISRTPKQKANWLDYFQTPEKVLKKMGLGKEAKVLRFADESYKSNLKTEMNKLIEWQQQVPDKESSRKIFQWLDGQETKASLNKKELAVAKELKTYLSEWADRLKLPKDKRLASYITHIFEKDFIQKEFDTGFAKLITDKPAGSVYDPFLQKRLGKMGYVEDVWRALQAYTKRAVRKEAMDPALKQLKESAVDLDKESLNYVMRLTHRINMRPTEVDNLIDNYIKSSPVGYKLGARPVSVISKSIRQAIYRGTLGLNIGSSMKNLSQGTNTYAKLGKKYTTAGYIDLIKKGNTGIEELKKVGVLEDSFIQDRSFNVVKQTMEKVDKGLFYFFETAEKINRGSAYFGAKKKALAEGKSEAKAIEYAKKMVRDTQFKFGAIDTPVILGSDTAKILLQFKSFTFKQAEFLGSMYKEKDWGGLMRWIASNVVVYSTIGRSFGWRIEDIIPDFKFQSPTGQLVKAGGKALSLDEDTRKEGRKELIKTVPGLIFPAGTQIKKTYEGAKLLTKGYSETPSGQARFLAPKGPIGKAQALAFGQWSTKQAKKYFKRGGHPTSAETMVKRKVVEALIKGDNEALNKLAPEAVKYSVDSKKAIKEAMALAIVENDDEAIKRIYPLIKKHGISNKVLKTAVRDLTYSTRDKNKMKVKMAKAILDDDDKKIKKLYSEFKKMGITDEALRKEIKKLK